MGFLGLWFLLEFGVGDELVRGEYSTCVHLKSRGSCHFLGGTPPIPFLRPPSRASGQASTLLRANGIPHPWGGYRFGGGASSGGMGSCLRRNDGGEGRGATLPSGRCVGPSR